MDLTIDIEMRLGPDDRPIVTGIAVRRSVPTEPRNDFKREPTWPEGAAPRALLPGEVGSLPLTTIVRGAVLWTESLKDEPQSAVRTGKRSNVARSLARLKGQRKGGRLGDDFYRTIAQANYKLVRACVPHPVQFLARQMGEPANKVHVWLKRARDRGYRTG